MSMETPSNWSRFQGVVPIMALPTAVVMPYAVQPLQLRGPADQAIRQYLSDGNRLLGLTILQPGWESRSDLSTAPVYSHGCLAEVTVRNTSPDERAVIMVRGLCRMRVDSDQAQTSLRTAQVVAVTDCYPSPPAIDRQRRRDELLDAFQLVHDLESLELFESLLRHELSLGCLTDMLAQSLPLPVSLSAELLSTSNVDLRSDLLLDYLRQAARSQRNASIADFSFN